MAQSRSLMPLSRDYQSLILLVSNPLHLLIDCGCAIYSTILCRRVRSQIFSSQCRHISQMRSPPLSGQTDRRSAGLSPGGEQLSTHHARCSQSYLLRHGGSPDRPCKGTPTLEDMVTGQHLPPSLELEESKRTVRDSRHRRALL